MENKEIRIKTIVYMYTLVCLYCSSIIASERIIFKDLVGYWFTENKGSNEKKYIYFGINKANQYIDIFSGPSTTRESKVTIYCKGEDCSIFKEKKIIFKFQVISKNKIKLTQSPLMIKTGGKDWDKKPTQFYKFADEGRILERDEKIKPAGVIPPPE